MTTKEPPYAAPVPGTPVSPLPIGGRTAPSAPTAAMSAHIASRSNPHSVTRHQVGLSQFVKSASYDVATNRLSLVLMGPTDEIPVTVQMSVKGDTGLPATVYQVNDPVTGLWHRLTVETVSGQKVLKLDQTGEQMVVKYTVPPGGASGQVLGKVSGNDYDVGWLGTSVKSDTGGVYVEI